MQKNRSKADQYIDQYPHLAKWLRTCVTCGATGYDPNIPEQIYRHFSFATAGIRSYFRPLPVDSHGHCSQCAGALGEPPN